MLLDFLKSFLGKDSRSHRPQEAADRIEEYFAVAAAQFTEGRIEDALATYRKVLGVDPYHVVALNQVALCLTRLQRNGEAGPFYERAALIDDSFAPALVNFAILLSESHQSGLAEAYLARAQKVVPGDPHIDGVMGAVKMLRGRPDEASADQLNGWLKGFDSFAVAHSYLFNVCYPSGATAEQVTAEHVFWAETLPPDAAANGDWIDLAPLTDLGKRKIRIGYMSGDFRSHSVRFFFRPLLENHDRDRFEVYGYYDMVYRDEQTEAIEPRFDHFRTIANLPDAEVGRMIRADQLDILVELAGHTSISRVHMMRTRLAVLQFTALGYPATTGVSGIDYKVVDAWTAPAGWEHLYAERLLRLPTSFWCFNPLEETPAPAAAPAVRNGYVTFGCFGNISKISRRVLACWASIMREVPECRLILKAITFKDQEAKASIQGWLESAGVDFSRVSLVPPDDPAQLYGAYADIDIILDTHPFNGGTTSCYALWMAVPIVTMAGQALISRMGASMLHTLGLDDLVAHTDEDYVRAAVSLAQDTPRLVQIRNELRQRMLASPLGNGALYAREFEQACERALEARRDGSDNTERPPTPVLPEKELIRRAQFVQQTGQPDAAMRIIDYCLKHYPDSVGGQIVKSSFWERKGDLQTARDMLHYALGLLPAGEDRRGVAINLARLDLLRGRYPEVQQQTEWLLSAPLDALGRLHVDLYQSAARSWEPTAAPAAAGAQDRGDLPFITVVVHCSDDKRFAEIEANLAVSLASGMYEVVRTKGEWRIGQYAEAVAGTNADIVLFVRSKVQVLSPLFHNELGNAMGHFDVIACAGSTRLAGTRWFDAGFPDVHGAVVLPNGGPVGGHNLSVYGPSHNRLHGGLKVLDDGLFAARRSVLTQVAFDQELDGEHGLCELDWFVRAEQAGFKLGAAPLLGVARFDLPGRVGRTWYDCAALFQERYKLDDTSESSPVSGASVLLPSLEHAMPLLSSFYTDEPLGDA